MSTEIGLNKIIFERNAKKVTDEINNPEKSLSSYGQLIEDVKSFCKCKTSWDVVFRLREENIAAHKLVKFALSVSREIIWLEGCLDCILSCTLNNQQYLVDC